jgi:mono/diheme cytochrome c family protein
MSGSVASRVLALLALAACVLPGKTYSVSPVISGTMRGFEEFGNDAELVLRIQHRDNPALAGQHSATLQQAGRFSFASIELEVAGHEYTKLYRAFLRIRDADDERLLWRAEFARGEIGLPVQLDCDLTRPMRQGQPCQVVDATRYPWLVRQGESAFQQRCAGCHGIAGLGDGPAADALITRPPDLRGIAARRGGRFDRAEIAERIEGRSLPIAHGSSEMPVWGEKLTQEYERYVMRDDIIAFTLDSVVTYLESVQQP